MGGEGNQGDSLNGEDEERGFLEDHEHDREEEGENEDSKVNGTGRRKVSHGAGDSGYDTVTTSSTMGRTPPPPLGLQTGGSEGSRRGSLVGGNQQQLGSGLERRTSPLIAYPPSISSSTKRIVVPVRIKTPGSPVMRTVTPTRATTFLPEVEKSQVGEEDDWGDNFSISSGEEQHQSKGLKDVHGQGQVEEEEERERGSLERAIDDLLANDQDHAHQTEEWDEKGSSFNPTLDRIRTTSINPLAVGEEDDEEVAEGWGL